MSQKPAVLCRQCQNHLEVPDGNACLSIVDETKPCRLCGATAVGGFTEFGVSDRLEECLANRKQNLEFVDDLLDSIRNDLKTKILEGRIPRTWSGKQLRKLIAEKAKEVDYVPMIRSELAAYHNDVLVNNL